MQHDLDVVRGLGLNCVRFFLRWPDFEPDLGTYDERMFERLTQFMRWCAERDLLAHPTLIVGFMSGGRFWPRGKGTRNLYADADLAGRSFEFCRRAAERVAPFHEHTLGLDLGNELSCVDAWGAAPEAIEAWCAGATAAIRKAYPAALVVSGLDSQAVMNDNGWRLGHQPGTDAYSVHTYPVPGWNLVPFDGMTDPFCQAILPFNTLAARAFGPVMVQEFSTILTSGAAECESYLKAVMPACLAHGANSFLWWCLRDIRTEFAPYSRHGFEGRLGLVDAADRVKPSLVWAVDFCRSLASAPAAVPAAPADTALYWPLEYYKRDNPGNPGNDPSVLWRRMLAWYYMLGRLGRRVGIARADLPMDGAVRTLIVPGAALTCAEVERLDAWVRAGGRVLWSGPTWGQWTVEADALIGASPVDIRSSSAVTVEHFGGRWALPQFPADGRTAVRVTTAGVVASTTEGDPAVLAHAAGKGRVVTVLPLAEEGLLAVAGKRAARDGWQAWFGGLLSLVEGRAP